MTTSQHASFSTTKEECSLIDRVVNRFMSEHGGHVGYDRMTLSMDLSACHSNGNPLKLAELLDADDFNFTHDVAGISQHICRKSGKLLDCFSPRYSK